MSKTAVQNVLLHTAFAVQKERKLRTIVGIAIFACPMQPCSNPGLKIEFFVAIFCMSVNLLEPVAVVGAELSLAAPDFVFFSVVTG